jgi:hypothetical protein
MSDQISDQNNDEIKTLIDAAGAGLMGLAMKALLRDGRDAADANLASVADGDAFIEATVLFTRRGVSAEGFFCSHGGRAHLFTVNALEVRQEGD